MDGTVRQLLDIKGSHVSTAHVNLSLLECAIMMKSKKIGSLLIVDKGLIGILHEREISRRGVARTKTWKYTCVSYNEPRICRCQSPDFYHGCNGNN